jgi:hypothetical protein
MDMVLKNYCILIGCSRSTVFFFSFGHLSYYFLRYVMTLLICPLLPSLPHVVTEDLTGYRHWSPGIEVSRDKHIGSKSF